jgi:hypothetical protein
MKERFKKLCQFCFAIVVFCKQVWRLAKAIFGKRPNENVPYKGLAPVDDASGIEKHIKALEWAVHQEHIRNIALTGPYGSGKSSIIKTFLRNNPLIAEKTITISLATFTEVTEEDEPIISENLEEGILKRLSCFPRVRSTRKRFGLSSLWKIWICLIFKIRQPTRRLKTMCWSIAD